MFPFSMDHPRDPMTEPVTSPVRAEHFKYSEYESYLEPPRPCPMCRGSEVEPWGKLGSFEAVRCSGCSHVFMHRVLSDEGLTRYYDDYVSFRLANPEKMSQRARMYEIDRDFLLRHVTSGRLLDVGCSSGEFLLVLGQQFDSYGVDRDATAVEMARERGDWLSPRIRLGDFEAFADQKEPFDVVVLRGVLEHLVEPLRALEHISELVVEGGVFFITATPNVESPSAELFRERWNQFDPIQHISHFSASHLSRTLAKFGFTLEGQYYPYLETPYARPEADLEQLLEAARDVDRRSRAEWAQSPAFWGNMMTLVFRRNPEIP